MLRRHRDGWLRDLHIGLGDFVIGAGEHFVGLRVIRRLAGDTAAIDEGLTALIDGGFLLEIRLRTPEKGLRPGRSGLCLHLPTSALATRARWETVLQQREHGTALDDVALIGASFTDLAGDLKPDPREHLSLDRADAEHPDLDIPLALRQRDRNRPTLRK